MGWVPQYLCRLVLVGQAAVHRVGAETLQPSHQAGEGEAHCPLDVPYHHLGTLHPSSLYSVTEIRGHFNAFYWHVLKCNYRQEMCPALTCYCLNGCLGEVVNWQLASPLYYAPPLLEQALSSSEIHVLLETGPTENRLFVLYCL